MPSDYAIRRRKKSRSCKDKPFKQWLRSITRSNEEIHEKTTAMTSSLRSLRLAKERLRNCIQKVIKHEEELRNEVETYKEDTQELRETANDITKLYRFDDKKQTLLNLHTTLALEDVFTARKQIAQIDDELNNMSPIVKDPTAANPNASARCYDQVTIPEPITSIMSNSLFKPLPPHPCCVCLENGANSVIVQCGHVCSCRTCADHLVKEPGDKGCPICRVQYNTILVISPE